jgi:inositol-phosphate transport system substrate-binding protein
MLSCKRWFILSALAITTILVVSACSAGPAAAPTTAPAAEPPASITITAWVQANQIEEFRAKNLVTAGERLTKELGGKTTVKVEATPDSAGWEDYKKKALLAFDAKTGPDIILSGHEDVAPWSENGYIMPLDDLIKKYSNVYDNVIPALWPSTQYKGKRWAIPQDAEARPLFWSKPVLKKLGWSDADINGLPDKIKKGEFTLADVIATAKQAQDKGFVAKGDGFWTRWSQGNDWYEFYYSFGGQVQDPATGKLVFVKDAWQKYYEYFYDAFNTSAVTRKDIIGASSSKMVYPGVSSGTVAFYFGGTWQWADWAQNYVADKGGEKWLNDTIGYGLIPASTKGGKPTTVTHPLVYMVSAQAKYPEIAFRVITLATSDDLNTLHAVGSGHLGILKTQANYPDYAKAVYLQSAQYMVDYANFIPNHAKFSVYDNIAWSALKGVASGEMKPDQALQLVQDQLKAQIPNDVIFK